MAQAPQQEQQQLLAEAVARLEVEGAAGGGGEAGVAAEQQMMMTGRPWTTMTQTQMWSCQTLRRTGGGGRVGGHAPGQPSGVLLATAG